MRSRTALIKGVTEDAFFVALTLKGVTRMLVDTDFTFGICPQYSEQPLLQERNIIRIHHKSAIVLFSC